MFSLLTVELFDRGPKNVKIWSCLKEDLVTELTESLANYIFPSMIDTTTDSVQQVASKLNGAQVTSHPSNITQIKPINQSLATSIDDLPIGLSLPLPSLLVTNKASHSSSNKGPSTLASLLFPDITLNTPPLKNSSLVLPSLLIQPDISPPPKAPLNVSVAATPIENLEYETPEASNTQESPGLPVNNPNAIEPVFQSVFVPPPTKVDHNVKNPPIDSPLLLPPPPENKTNPIKSAPKNNLKVKGSKGPVVDRKRPTALSIQPEPEEQDDMPEMDEESTAPLYSGKEARIFMQKVVFISDPYRMRLNCLQCIQELRWSWRQYHFPANTRRCFDVDSTLFKRYGRQMDVDTTLCAYWVGEQFPRNNPHYNAGMHLKPKSSISYIYQNIFS